MTVIRPLIAESITRSFGDHNAVAAASVTLAPGEITALIGQSGSGKTTFLRLLAGMERPDKGRVLSGEDVLASPDRHVPIEERQIGLVFQDFALFPHLTVLENVMFGLRSLGKPERISTAEQWIERLGLTGRRDAYPHHLSGGEQQRTAIARALAPQPVAILLDEPFSGLDPTMRDHVRDVALSAVRESGIPALLVTHDANEALVHSDTLAVIDQGRILQSGSPEALYRKPVSLEVARALGPVHSISASALPTEWHSAIGRDAEMLWYRPEAIRLGSGTSFNVTGSKLAGPVTELALSLSASETIFAACQPGSPIALGDQVQANINPALFFDFVPNSV